MHLLNCFSGQPAEAQGDLDSREIGPLSSVHSFPSIPKDWPRLTFELLEVMGRHARGFRGVEVCLAPGLTNFCSQLGKATDLDYGHKTGN